MRKCSIYYKQPQGGTQTLKIGVTRKNKVKEMKLKLRRMGLELRRMEIQLEIKEKEIDLLKEEINDFYRR